MGIVRFSAFVEFKEIFQRFHSYKAIVTLNDVKKQTFSCHFNIYGWYDFRVNWLTDSSLSDLAPQNSINSRSWSPVFKSYRVKRGGFLSTS